MGYDIILADIDNTLLDFTAGSRAAVRCVLEFLGVAFTQERVEAYFRINHSLWDAYERGEIEKDAIYTTRWTRFLEYLGVEGTFEAVNACYKKGLQSHIFYMPHCMEFLRALPKRCKLYAVTNGDTENQVVRLRNSGLDTYFDGVFISEQMGSKKPEKDYFDKVFAAIGPVDRDRCILLGDSLTSDMQGGRNAGIKTCLLGKDTGDPRCDYVISDLMEFLKLL